LAFFDLEEDFFACGSRSNFTEKEGLHKERVPIRGLADYVLRLEIGVNFMKH
jgi:hypothetical protein